MDYTNSQNPQPVDQNIIGWDDFITADVKEFIVLDEGDYPFRVSSFTRGSFPGSAKIPACNKAIVTISIDTPQGTAGVKFDLILYRSMEWRISSFLIAIGMMKKGDQMKVNWNDIVGRTGWAHIKTRLYNDKSGNQRKANDVDYFIAPERAPKQMPVQAAPQNTPSWVTDAERQINAQQAAGIPRNQMPPVQQQYPPQQYAPQQMPPQQNVPQPVQQPVQQQMAYPPQPQGQNGWNGEF